jgi:hypothetical protein
MSDRTSRADTDQGSLDADTTFARDGAAWSEVTLLSADNHRLRLGGLLRPAWMIGVCNGLAREQLSIDRAHARRLSHDGTWIAELHLVGLPGSRDPRELRFIDFAETDAIPSAGALQLDEYTLLDSPAHGGTLQLTFAAQDAVGLLGALLSAFASLQLLPVEMHIETRDQRAQDCLWLAATGNSRPTHSDRQALDALLRASLRQ